MYSIVHLTPDQLVPALSEMFRVLERVKPGNHGRASPASFARGYQPPVSFMNFTRCSFHTAARVCVP